MPQRTFVSRPVAVDDAAIDEVEALAQDRVQDPVLDEARHLALDDGVVADVPHELDGGVDGRLRRVVAGDDLDHRDQVRRVRPVHADDALGVLQVGRDLGDRDARRVRGEDRVRRDVLLERGEQLLLQLEPLGNRLDHELAPSSAVARSVS